MTASDWNLEADGNVWIPRVKQFHVSGMGLALGIRISTGPVPDGLKGQPETLQVGLSTTQARELAALLLGAADTLDQKLGGTS